MACPQIGATGTLAPMPSDDEIIINAPASQVWQYLGWFAGLCEWLFDEDFGAVGAPKWEFEFISRWRTLVTDASGPVIVGNIRHPIPRRLVTLSPSDTDSKPHPN